MYRIQHLRNEFQSHEYLIPGEPAIIIPFLGISELQPLNDRFSDAGAVIKEIVIEAPEICNVAEIARFPEEWKRLVLPGLDPVYPPFCEFILLMEFVIDLRSRQGD